MGPPCSLQPVNVCLSLASPPTYTCTYITWFALHLPVAAAGARPPSLSLLLTYLLHLYSQYTSEIGSSGSVGGGGHSSRSRVTGGNSNALVVQLMLSSGGKLAGALLKEGRDEGPLPPDVSGQGYAERDVQVRE